MKRHEFRLIHRLRVRWAEVDMQKIVFNAHYLMYFDTAISDYWRALALPYEEAMLQLGGELYVKKASVEYHGSARFDDQLEVALKCTRIGTSSMIFTGAIFRADALLVTCELVYVFADPTSQTSRPVPPALRDLVDCFEAGERVLATRVGDWTVLGPQAVQIRATVFVQEQGSSSEHVWDEADRSALHAVAFNALGQGIATGRLVGLDHGVAKIGCLAVHCALRGAHIGQGVLETLVQEARGRGYTKAMLHAQSRALGFCLRLGFTLCGESFDAAGISHIEMAKAL